MFPRGADTSPEVKSCYLSNKTLGKVEDARCPESKKYKTPNQ